MCCWILASACRSRGPADQQLAAAGDAADQRLGRVGHRLGQAFGALVLEVSAVEELLLDALFGHAGMICEPPLCEGDETWPCSSAFAAGPVAGRGYRQTLIVQTGE